MSEIAGRLAAHAAGQYFMHPYGGPRLLRGGSPGLAPAKVVILGGGVVGTQAALLASGMHADVIVLDVSPRRVRELEHLLETRAQVLQSDPATLLAEAARADVIIGAVLVPGAAAPKLISRRDLAQPKRGALLIDVAIDQGGSFQTSRPTTYPEPTYEVDGIVHYCVANMPGAVPQTSTRALTNATLPYIRRIANLGIDDALVDDPGLSRGLNTHAGTLTRRRGRGARLDSKEQHAMTSNLDLTAFKALSFDCYGTLIDWEAGIAAILVPWAREQGLDLGDEELLLAYADNEAAVERETPSARYPDVLGTAFRRTGETLGAPVSDEWARRLGESVPDWPAFPDSADALARLRRHYQLIILSNVHRAGFAGSNQHLRGDFAAIITAEDVGAYKPAENHFRALDAALPGLGVERNELLHVAQSLFHDHVPAKREGLHSVWINRRHDRPGWGATPEPSEEWTYNLEFKSMGDFADAVDRAFAGR